MPLPPKKPTMLQQDGLNELVRDQVKKELQPYVNHLQRLGCELRCALDGFLARVDTDRCRLEQVESEKKAPELLRPCTKMGELCNKAHGADKKGIVCLDEEWRGIAGERDAIDPSTLALSMHDAKDTSLEMSRDRVNSSTSSGLLDYSSPPVPPNGELIPVWVRTQFMDLGITFDGTNERITCQLRYVLTWCDPRLESWSDKVQLPSKLWTPLQRTRSEDQTESKAFIENGQNFSCCLIPDLEIDTSNAILRAPIFCADRPTSNEAQGVWIRQSMTNVMVDVPLVDWQRLRAFPNDEVSFGVLLACWEVLSCSENQKAQQIINLRIDSAKPLEFFGHTGGAEWEIAFASTVEGYHQSPSSGNVYHDAIVSVTLRRRHGYYAWKAVIPLTVAIFLVGCSFAVHYRSEDGFSLRLSALVAVYFSIFVVQQSVMDRLPRTPILTNIDKIANICIVVVFLAALDSSVLHLISSRIYMSDDSMINLDVLNIVDGSVVALLLVVSFVMIFCFTRVRREPQESVAKYLNFYGNSIEIEKIEKVVVPTGV